ncbi:MAG: hypothetical protein N2379_02920 [Verrucomicrobiae bacterium]|nr:hypothetical protein [Verrucomicrobiae bacterium]
MKTPFRGFTAILLKEFTVVFRDPTTLFFMFFPAIDANHRVRLRAR